jgi:hypothetical protein
MNCKGIFGRLFGHNYQPVFNSTPPEEFELQPGSTGRVSSVLSIIDAMTRTEYVHSCCTRCGDVIEAVMP